MSDVAVEVRGVSKKFRKGEIYDSLRDLIPALARKTMDRNGREGLGDKEFWALNKVSFEVRQGEACAIIGGNGAGKSTILKLLSRILMPTHGAIHLHGALSALIEAGAGFHADLTGRENIFLSGAILGMKKEEIKRQFDQIVEFAELGEFIDTPVKRYSSGMFARLGFSVSAHVNPDILLVDEVLSVGDYVFQARCLEKMKEITRSGATVIFVSHNLKAVADLCKRAILLERGCLTADGDTSDVIRKYLERASGTAMEEGEKDICIRSVSVRNAFDEGFTFRTGESIYVDVVVIARKRCEKLSLSLYVEDESLYNVFDTSTERMGLGTFALDAGEVLRATYELRLHLARGLFHIGVLVYRYDLQREYDKKMPAATIHVSAESDVRGCANLYPKITRYVVESERPGLEVAGPIEPRDAATGAAGLLKTHDELLRGRGAAS